MNRNSGQDTLLPQWFAPYSSINGHRAIDCSAREERGYINPTIDPIQEGTPNVASCHGSWGYALRLYLVISVCCWVDTFVQKMVVCNFLSRVTNTFTAVPLSFRSLKEEREKVQGLFSKDNLVSSTGLIM